MLYIPAINFEDGPYTVEELADEVLRRMHETILFYIIFGHYPLSDNGWVKS